MNSFSIADLAKIVSGQVVGDPDKIITGYNSLSLAKDDEVSFFYSVKYLSQLTSTKAGAVLTNIENKDKIKNGIISKKPRLDFIKIINTFYPPAIFKNYLAKSANIAKDVKLPKNHNIAENVTIASGCKLAENVIIEAGVSIAENCELSENCHLYPGVVIYKNCKIGKNAIIHANCVIGSDGFGFETDNGWHHKIPHNKGVIIEDDVEIGSVSTIDSGSMLPTKIGKGSKLDNKVQIAHNVQLGECNIICAGACLAGSIKTGKNVTIGGNSVVADGLKIADYTVLGGLSGLISSTTKAAILFGFPAFDFTAWKKAHVYIKKLPELFKKNKNQN